MSTLILLWILANIMYHLHVSGGSTGGTEGSVPLFMLCHYAKLYIVYDTKKSLEMTYRPDNQLMINRRRILHRFKLRQNAPLDNLFIVDCLNSFKLPKHHLKLRNNAQLSDLVLKKILAVQTSKTSNQQRQYALVCVHIFKCFSAIPTSQHTTPDHFPISSKLYFAHAAPLVTNFASMQPRRLKMPNIIDSDDKC